MLWLKDLWHSAMTGLAAALRRLGDSLWERLLSLSPAMWRNIAFGATAAVALYYVLGMVIIHRVDDDPDVVANLTTEPGGSVAVAAVANLIDREINQHRWVANDPFFLPSALLDNMPNYQQGLMGAMARFALELRDQIGRTRGSSSEDEDLGTAAGFLPYPGDIWIFNFSTSILPVASSERQYLRARTALIKYNRRLAAGEAVFERRGDNLMATLDRVALDVGASSAALDSYVSEHSGDWFDFGSDDLFYRVKGQAYGYLMILEALRRDYREVIENRELGSAYDQMLGSFRAVALLDPIFVFNNEPGGLALPNHLTDQGFYLLRARTQLREITNILLK